MQLNKAFKVAKIVCLGNQNVAHSYNKFLQDVLISMIGLKCGSLFGKIKDLSSNKKVFLEKNLCRYSSILRTPLLLEKTFLKRFFA